MDNLYLWIILLLDILFLLLITYVNKLSIKRNYCFILIAMQVYLYICFSPVLTALNNNIDEKQLYIKNIILSIFFFQIPFVISYFYFSRKTRKQESLNADYKIVKYKQFIVLVSFLVFGLVFIYNIISNNLIFIRIGSEARAEQVVNLSSSLISVFARMIEKNAIFLTCYLMFIICVKKINSYFDIFLILILVFLLLSFGLYFLINTKLYFILFLMSLLTILLYKSSVFDKTIKISFKPFIFVLFLMFYSFIVTSNIRGNFIQDSGIKLHSFVPWDNAAIKSEESFVKRLDGVDLMTKISQKISLSNIPLGEAWVNPIFLTYGFLLDKERTTNLKMETNTTAKYYLMQKYTDINSADYYSCMLTDLYGNFWIFGLIFGSIILSKLTQITDTNLRISTSPNKIIISIYLLCIILPFEQEFISIPLSFLQSFPILFFVLIINPIKINSKVQ